jgi:hypothetical protein
VPLFLPAMHYGWGGGTAHSFRQSFHPTRIT